MVQNKVIENKEKLVSKIELLKNEIIKEKEFIKSLTQIKKDCKRLELLTTEKNLIELIETSQRLLNMKQKQLFSLEKEEL